MHLGIRIFFLTINQDIALKFLKNDMFWQKSSDVIEDAQSFLSRERKTKEPNTEFLDSLSLRLLAKQFGIQKKADFFFRTFTS